MEKKKIENLYCLIEALYDVKDAFKAIVFLTCTVFIIWYSSVIVSRAFAIALFVVLPLLIGVLWFCIYKEAFADGALSIEEIEKKDEDNKEGR